MGMALSRTNWHATEAFDWNSRARSSTAQETAAGGDRIGGPGKLVSILHPFDGASDTRSDDQLIADPALAKKAAQVMSRPLFPRSGNLSRPEETVICPTMLG
jgi:hypothetical protein